MTLQPYSTEPTFEDRMAAAYSAGAVAKRSGRTLDSCPHRDGTPAHEHWSCGWSEAKARKPRRVLEVA